MIDTQDFKYNKSSTFTQKSNYENLNIAVRHADTFLKDETLDKCEEIIELFKKYGTVKQTGKKK